MKRFISISLLITALLMLFRFREGALNLLSWFGSLETISTSMEDAGIW